MKRNSLALAAGIALALGSSAVVTADASFVNTSAAAMLQGQATSRWQPDRFGPIVASDTLWSIAMYYGDATDLSVYEMMDLFIELNPEAFINGRADRMMDGYYLKVPEVAQRARAGSSEEAVVAATTDSPKVTTSDMPEVETNDAAAVVEADNSDTTVDSPVVTEAAPTASNTAEASSNIDDASSSRVEFDVAELTQLRTQLAESISLIERLNAENSALQQRLDSVNKELEQLRLKVNAEQVAEDELQEQIAAEIVATKVEAGEAQTTPQASSTSEPKPVKRKQQSEYEEFLDWLMQPFQLTLAILIPLLLAAIIWYVLYVRRLNRETLGPYNGAMQAAEQEQQEQGDSEEKLSAYEEAEQAALAEEAADMPEFERLDDEEDEVVAQEAEADDNLDDELNALDHTEDEFETIDETVDEETDLDTLLASSFDDEETDNKSNDESSDLVADAQTTVETEELAEVESTEPSQPASTEDDLSLEFDTAFEPEAEPKAETKPVESASSDDDEMSLDFHIDEANSASEQSAVPAVDDAHVTDLEVELEQFEDVDLDDIDLEALTTEEATKSEAEDDADDGTFLEIDALLEEAESADSDFDSPRFERESGQVDDNEETPSGMIDLARAYLEMDEYELARTELEKVAQTDDEDAKREAAMLLQKIEEQGH
ncbi:MAG: hypothetical protein COA51_02135 [Idiomarina sp.]|nr:MAG: hypothetical protein COA51_02135 [Idiomarina sp.]